MDDGRLKMYGSMEFGGVGYIGCGKWRRRRRIGGEFGKEEEEEDRGVFSRRSLACPIVRYSDRVLVLLLNYVFAPLLN